MERELEVALVRRELGVAGAPGQAVQRHVQLLGGDLGQGGGDALADLDLADRDVDAALGEAQPAVEARVVGEAFRQLDHRAFSRAARSTARRMRG